MSIEKLGFEVKTNCAGPECFTEEAHVHHHWVLSAEYGCANCGHPPYEHQVLRYDGTGPRVCCQIDEVLINGGDDWGNDECSCRSYEQGELVL